MDASVSRRAQLHLYKGKARGCFPFSLPTVLKIMRTAKLVFWVPQPFLDVFLKKAFPPQADGGSWMEFSPFLGLLHFPFLGLL